MHHLIRSISIKADSRQILYVDHAWYLLSIMQQRKRESSQSLIHDFEDYPIEYAANTAAADANISQGTFVQAVPLAEKQVALYRHIKNAKINWQITKHIAPAAE